MNHPQLYTKDSTSKIRVWYVEQAIDHYRTVAGVLDGNLVCSEWTVAKGKNTGRANETTPFQQACKEVAAKYTKQLESGYHEKIEEVDNITFFEPMLAHKYLDHKNKVNWTQGVYISPKLDGVRCIFTKDGAFSRQGKQFISFPHIARELQQIFKECPGLILDGEIYTHRLNKDFNKIISLAKKSKPTAKDLAESEKYLEYWIFDIPSDCSKFSSRYKNLSGLIEEYFNGNKWIKLVPHTYAGSELLIEEAVQNFMTEGYEGVMINLPEGLYEHKRSTALLKYKLFTDGEFEILDITEGTGNRSGMFGRALLKLENGETFEANARGNEEFYTQLLKDRKELIGKQATVRYQNLTPNGVPRFPVIVAIRSYE